MNRNDIQKHLIYTTLTRNSTTLYTTENFQLVHAISNINCLEIIGQELGAISGLKTLVGSIPLTTKKANVELAIYFIKKTFTNADGSTDLITVVSIAHAYINRTLVLSILKKIMDKYIEFNQDTDLVDDKKSRLGEFKLYMNQIIKFEEMNYDSNSQIYNYGSVQDEEAAGGDVISPRSLVLVNEEVEEVRQLMLDNIRNLMNRGDKINLLVDQTDRLTSSSLVFRRRTQSIKRHMWFSNFRLLILVGAGAFLLVYIFSSSSSSSSSFLTSSGASSPCSSSSSSPNTEMGFTATCSSSLPDSSSLVSSCSASSVSSACSTVSSTSESAVTRWATSLLSFNLFVVLSPFSVTTAATLTPAALFFFFCCTSLSKSATWFFTSGTNPPYSLRSKAPIMS